MNAGATGGGAGAGEPTRTSPCEICQNPCDKHCVRCMSVTYCSKEHQAQDWKRHKLVCFPIKIIPRPDPARPNANIKALIATRDIKQGEIVLKEKPLVTGPRGALEFPDRFPLCLECYRLFPEDNDDEEAYLCSKCKWPLCGPSCENGKTHSKLECPILAEKKVPKAYGVSDYMSICILRGLLISEKNPQVMELFRDLDHEVHNYSVDTIYGMAIHFIQDKKQCDLAERFDLDKIKLVAGVYHNHRMSDEGDGSNSQPVGTYIYYKANFSTHSCVPNSMWFIQSNDEVYVRASVPIKKGELVTTTCVEMEQHTAKRRKTLSIFGIDCKCERCLDPTEKGTYMSAVKCIRANCPNGYYLAVNPLDNSKSAVWKCTNCSSTKTGGEIESIETKAATELNVINAEWESEENPHLVASYLRKIKKEEKFIKKYDGKILHKNHMLLFSLKRQLVGLIPQLTPHIENENDRNEIEMKQVACARECLDLADKFWPGYSRYRGQLLYMLQRGLFCLIFTEVEKLSKSRRSQAYNQERLTKLREAFQELLTFRQEVKTILSIERDGKSEKNLALEMDQEGIDIRRIRQVLRI